MKILRAFLAGAFGVVYANLGAATEAVADNPLRARAEESIRRGAAFLLKTQNRDGSWGSHHPVVFDSSQGGWPLDSPGAQHGITNAVTALCARALLNFPERKPEALDAVRKAADYLLNKWEAGFAQGYHPDAWCYAYGLEFLADMAMRPEGATWKSRISDVAPKLVSRLAAAQLADGGWAYYASPGGVGNGASFTTGTALLALLRARESGWAVPPGVARDAATLLEALRFPDGNFAYDSRFASAPDPGWPLQPLGATSRTQAANVALYECERRLKIEDLRSGLDWFLKTADYLEVGRKRIIPHRDAPHNISGYFFFYGYYYAAEAIYRLPVGERQHYWEPIVEAMLRTQEENGSWWDSICYDYGDKWGTAFAMLALERFLLSK